MSDSGAQLKTLSASLKHVTLAGVDINKDVLAKFGLTAADKADVVEQAQKHAPEIANEFSKWRVISSSTSIPFLATHTGATP